MGYRHTRFITCTDWYQWETKEWYLKEGDLQAGGKDHDGGQGRNMEERKYLEEIRSRIVAQGNKGRSTKIEGETHRTNNDNKSHNTAEKNR